MFRHFLSQPDDAVHVMQSAVIMAAKNCCSLVMDMILPEGNIWWNMHAALIELVTETYSHHVIQERVDNAFFKVTWLWWVVGVVRDEHSWGNDAWFFLSNGRMYERVPQNLKENAIAHFDNAPGNNIEVKWRLRKN